MLSIVTLTVSAVDEGDVTVSNKCRWRHNWSDWGNPIEKHMMFEMRGQYVQGIERVQRRTCSKCNKTEERNV